MKEDTGGRRRIAWLDTARAYGILLVLYGHFVEVISRGDNPNALTQQKLIYAFHMPLFILLSGYLAKAQLPGLWPFLRKQAATRLLPVVFFSVLMIPLGLVVDSLMGRDGFPPGMRARWVDDWQDLSGRLAPPHGEDFQDIRARLWAGMGDSAQVAVRLGAAGDSLTAAQRRLITRSINAQLDQRDLYSPDAFGGAKLPLTVQLALEAGTVELADGDPVRSHNARLTWWTLFPEQDWWWEEDSFRDEWLRDVIWTLRGYPNFNWLTWFLICLFTVELIHFLVVPYLTSSLRVGLAIPLFCVVGWLATMDVGRREDFWFARESLLLYAFYLAGYLLCRTGVLQRLSRRGSVALLVMVGAGTLGTFQLNPGSPMYNPVVLVNLSQHGHVGLFLLTALTGSLMAIALAQITPASRLISMVGRHTLVLMALSCIYFRPLNYLIADLLPVGPSHLELVLWCTAVALAQMASLAPLIWLLSRYLPQLTGMPRVAGPWLPKLVD